MNVCLLSFCLLASEVVLSPLFAPAALRPVSPLQLCHGHPQHGLHSCLHCGNGSEAHCFQTQGEPPLHTSSRTFHSDKSPQSDVNARKWCLQCHVVRNDPWRVILVGYCSSATSQWMFSLWNYSPTPPPHCRVSAACSTALCRQEGQDASKTQSAECSADFFCFTLKDSLVFACCSSVKNHLDFSHYLCKSGCLCPITN